MTYQNKTCAVCEAIFEPTSGTQRVCDLCRSSGLCDCGSPVTGSSLWGDQWGGECDRAESRASSLLDRLAA